MFCESLRSIPSSKVYESHLQVLFWCISFATLLFLFLSARPNEEEKMTSKDKNNLSVRSILFVVELVQKEERFAVPNRVDFKMKLLLMVNYLALSVSFTKICEINFI